MKNSATDEEEKDRRVWRRRLQVSFLPLVFSLDEEEDDDATKEKGTEKQACIQRLLQHGNYCWY